MFKKGPGNLKNSVNFPKTDGPMNQGIPIFLSLNLSLMLMIFRKFWWKSRKFSSPFPKLKARTFGKVAQFSPSHLFLQLHSIFAWWLVLPDYWSKSVHFFQYISKNVHFESTKIRSGNPEVLNVEGDGKHCASFFACRMIQTRKLRFFRKSTRKRVFSDLKSVLDFQHTHASSIHFQMPKQEENNKSSFKSTIINAPA